MGFGIDRHLVQGELSIAQSTFIVQRPLKPTFHIANVGVYSKAVVVN
jgi:hypothetical protein